MRGVGHHIHKRKQLEPYPHPRFWVRVVDGVAVAAGIIGPIMTLPQLLKIYVEHNASGVSAISWFSWMILDIPFIIYGIVHKDRVIIMTYTAWFFLNMAVTIGVIIYG
ncbi:MAG: PQ-loop domain-containing transporter [bacterium]|nr:PQ-loop domain-containing transporter [bacterium]